MFTFLIEMVAIVLVTFIFSVLMEILSYWYVIVGVIAVLLIFRWWSGGKRKNY